MATPSELFDWQVRYLDIYLFYVFASRGSSPGQIGGSGRIVKQSCRQSVRRSGRFSSGARFISVSAATPHGLVQVMPVGVTPALPPACGTNTAAARLASEGTGINTYHNMFGVGPTVCVVGGVACVVVSGVRRMNQVNPRRARLVPGWG